MVKVNADGTKKVKGIYKLLPKKPKRVTNGFGSFLKEFWPSIAAGNRTRDSMNVASLHWYNLTPDQKNHYRDLAVADRNRYNTEITLWKRQKAFLTRPASMYALFVKDVWQRERNNDATTIPQVGSLAANEWRALTDAQKQPYRVRFERARRNYQLSVLDFQQGLGVDLDRQLDTEEEYVPLLPQPQQLDELDLEEDELDLEEDEDALAVGVGQRRRRRN